jgi:hypothetical protein
MKFPYSAYAVDHSATVPDGVVYRPEIVVRVVGVRGSVTLQALADTGSDETVFPASLAMALGIQLDHNRATTASGVGGHTVRLVPGRVTLELAQGAERYRWSSTVAFLESDELNDEVSLLGFLGFLEFFTATFDSESYEINLTANSRLPSE